MNRLPESPGPDGAIETFENLVFFRRRLEADDNRGKGADEDDKWKAQ